MAISWNTYASLNASEATVHYGDSPLHLDKVVFSNQTTFLTSRTFSHHAVLNDLKPKTKYHYRVAYTNCAHCSTIPTYTFTTPREAGCTDEYTVAVVADMGLMGPDGLTDAIGSNAVGALLPGETNTIQSMTQNLDAFEHIIHVGDLAYADYFLRESVGGFFGNGSIIVNASSVVEHYETLNEQFYDELTSLTANKAYMVAVGNHESNCDNGGITDAVNNITYTAKLCMPGQTNFTAYTEHWNMPGTPGKTQNFWYSYVRVLYPAAPPPTDKRRTTEWSTTSSWTSRPISDKVSLAPTKWQGGTGKKMSPTVGYYNQQIDFLKADLAAVDRSVTPWVMAFGHRPYYNGIGDALCTQCKAAFEDILYDGGVDLVMNGHNHVYSRSYPVYNNTIDPNGYNNPSAPMYITNGLGGHYDGVDVSSDPLPAVIAKGIDAVYGWSLLTFANSTHMKHEFVASRNSTVLDTTWLYKQH
ncbi:acid phosphatase type 7, partial [Tremellales sp. Uapishka_1]